MKFWPKSIIQAVFLFLFLFFFSCLLACLFVRLFYLSKPGNIFKNKIAESIQSEHCGGGLELIYSKCKI